MEFEMGCNYQSKSSSLSILPDGTSSSDKMLMWSSTSSEFSGIESGYSTQAPSISAYDSASAHDSISLQPQQPQQHDMSKLHFFSNAQPNIAAFNSNEIYYLDEDDKIANSANNNNCIQSEQDNLEAAIEMLLDEDLVIVREASQMLNSWSRQDRIRRALIYTKDVVPSILQCLWRTQDLETVLNLLGVLYGVSTQPEGLQAIYQTNAPSILVTFLAAPVERIVSYAITTIHNILLNCSDAMKAHLRNQRAVQNCIALLSFPNPNPKMLTIVVDCLFHMVHSSPETKLVMLEEGGTQQLIGLLFNHTQQYPKLIQNTIRLLKLLSICNNNKQLMIRMNLIQPLSSHLMSSSFGTSSNSREMITNILMTLRNLSGDAYQLPNLAPFITGLVNFLASSQDPNHIEKAAEILSNLTYRNESNKIAAINSNAIPLLLKLISTYSGLFMPSVKLPRIVDSCMCTLRHLTIRHAEIPRIHEQLRAYNGIHILASVLQTTPRHWGVIKATLGVVRNLLSNQLNLEYMRQFNMISNLMTILFEVVQLIKNQNSNNQDLKHDGINLFEIVEASTGSLLLLAKETFFKIEMLKLECIKFFVEMFCSPFSGIQQPAAVILAELASLHECALAIEQVPGFHEFVQSNFLNQFEQLVSSGSGNSTALLAQVNIIMERIQEHRSNSNTNNMTFY